MAGTGGSTLGRVKSQDGLVRKGLGVLQQMCTYRKISTSGQRRDLAARLWEWVRSHLCHLEHHSDIKDTANKSSAKGSIPRARRSSACRLLCSSSWRHRCSRPDIRRSRQRSRL